MASRAGNWSGHSKRTSVLPGLPCISHSLPTFGNGPNRFGVVTMLACASAPTKKEAPQVDQSTRLFSANMKVVNPLRATRQPRLGDHWASPRAEPEIRDNLNELLQAIQASAASPATEGLNPRGR